MMWVKIVVFISLLNCCKIFVNGYLQVGIILKKGNENLGANIEKLLKSNEEPNGNFIQIVKEVAEEEDARSYHRAFSRLLASGIDVFISPVASPYSSILIAYAYEYNIPLITPELPEAESELSREANSFSFGIGQNTARAMLHLFQFYGWKDVVYLYDHESGPENLHHIYLLGHRVLNLTLSGLLKVTSAEEANVYLQNLDKSFKNKLFHVVLDTETSMAREIIWRHVNDIHVRKKNFHFLLSKPTLEDFWTSEKTAYGAVNVTTFLIKSQRPGSDDFLELFKSSETENYKISSYYYHDAALVLKEAARRFLRSNIRTLPATNTSTKMEQPMKSYESAPVPRPNGIKLSMFIKETIVQGATGRIQFENGQRIGMVMNITEVTPSGFQHIGYWSNGILRPTVSAHGRLPTASPLIQRNQRLQIVTILSSPFMMLKTGENETGLVGNDRFEGYCKDLIDMLTKKMNVEYDLRIVEDGSYGRYKKLEGKWSGMIGDIIQGKADLALADLTITGERQRVVDFTDPYEMVGFSLIMKNPRAINKLSSISFFLCAFTADVWICILFAAILFCVLFHFITKFTGAPDSIESASGIWGRKHTLIANLWFAAGCSLLRSTGVYPRSISSRILSGFFWFFTLILSSLFIASVTAQILAGLQTDENNPQLSQLKSLSLEAIISESISRKWPSIGLVYPSYTKTFMQQSKLPIYMKFTEYLEENNNVIVKTDAEGLERVRQSAGGYMLLMESLRSQYAIRRQPCDLVATHDSVYYSGLGLATPLGSPLTLELNAALHAVQREGALGHLHRKWWIDTTECQNSIEEDRSERTIHVFSGLLCVTAVGFLIVLGVFAVQYIRRNQNKENRRQQLSFEDMNLGQPLPTPPPELLAEPTPVLNLPEYDKKTLL